MNGVCGHHTSTGIDEKYIIDFREKRYIIPTMELSMRVHDFEEFISDPSKLHTNIEFTIRRWTGDKEQILEKERFIGYSYNIIGHLLTSGSLERYKKKKD